jgi:hypothetical protein
MRKLNLIGQKYHKLIVLEEAPTINGRSAWLCRCDCGVLKIIKTENLRDGSTQSCGCWNREQSSKRAENMYSKCIKYAPEEASARRIWQKTYQEMPYEDFYMFSQQNCYYCGEPPSNYQNVATKLSSQNMKKNGNFTYNGLDRLDNSKPHSKENCVACCKYCNYAKRERSVDDFKLWIKKVYDHLINP